jgi:hypothetical protein
VRDRGKSEGREFLQHDDRRHNGVPARFGASFRIGRCDRERRDVHRWRIAHRWHGANQQRVVDEQRRTIDH